MSLKHVPNESVGTHVSVGDYTYALVNGIICRWPRDKGMFHNGTLETVPDGEVPPQAKLFLHQLSALC